MELRVSSSELCGSVHAPPSKSHTHRAVVLGSLSRSCKVLNPLLSDDTLATINACRKLGARISFRPGELRIRGFEGYPQTPGNIINLRNSGTSLRIISGICSLADGYSVLTGGGSLRSRPNQPLLDALSSLGAFATSLRGDGRAPLIIKGRLKGGWASLSAKISSQFLSSLLICCPGAEWDTELEVRDLVSRPYADLTLEMLRSAGIQLHIERAREGIKYFIPGSQEYNASEFLIPADFSSAGFLIAAALVTGSRIRIDGLYPSNQPDQALIPILERMGAQLKWDRDAGRLEIMESQLEGVQLDLRDNPDLVPIMAVLGCFASNQTRIINIGHLRYKEVDRIAAICEELSRLGAQIQAGPDYIVVRESKLSPGTVWGRWDHRTGMALAVAGLGIEGETIVKQLDIQKSYPEFLEHLKQLNARILSIQK